MDENNSFKKISELLKNSEKFLITTHTNPDGDAIGSQLALCSLFREMGKKSEIINPFPLPEKYNFLPDSKSVKCRVSSKEKFDALWVLDCSDWGRTGNIQNLRLQVRATVNLDHHPDNTFYGDYNYVKINASCTGEIIYEFIKFLKYPIGFSRAMDLYTAVVTDTGCFRFPNVCSQTHLMVAELLEENIPCTQIVKWIYDDKRMPVMKLLGMILSTLQTSSDGQIAWIQVTQEMYDKTGAKEEDTEDFVNYLGSISGVKIALFFRESRGNGVRVCIRSQDEKVEVNLIARHFGGGGHTKAAGFCLSGPLSVAEKKVLEWVKQSL